MITSSACLKITKHVDTYRTILTLSPNCDSPGPSPCILQRLETVGCAAILSALTLLQIVHEKPQTTPACTARVNDTRRILVKRDAFVFQGVQIGRDGVVCYSESLERK